MNTREPCGIGRLTANIAHEIRNPLASISGSVEVLRKQPGTDAEARQLIDIAVREVDRVNGLISGLLDYARPRTEDRQRLDLGEMVTEIAKVFEQEQLRFGEGEMALVPTPRRCS
jgi:two-component system sensor histidine kinase PilS (NtrC family)